MVTNSGRKWPESWKVFRRSIIENIYKRFIGLWNVCKHSIIFCKLVYKKKLNFCIHVHACIYIYINVYLCEWARDVHRKHDAATVAKFSGRPRRRIVSFADFTASTSFTDWNSEFFADSSLESSIALTTVFVKKSTFHFLQFVSKLLTKVCSKWRIFPRNVDETGSR